MTRQTALSIETAEERARRAEEEERELNRQRQLFSQLMGEVRAATIAMGGPKVVAGVLDQVWGVDSIGRGVSESKYRACLADDGERNYFRIEWIIELALHPGVADVLRRIADGKTEIEPSEECENWRAIVRERYPKDAAGMERQARSMRRSRR